MVWRSGIVDLHMRKHGLPHGGELRGHAGANRGRHAERPRALRNIQVEHVAPVIQHAQVHRLVKPFLELPHREARHILDVAVHVGGPFQQSQAQPVPRPLGVTR